MSAETEAAPETPDQVKARKVAALAAHGPRYARLAPLLLGADDPLFALAHLVVDHEARLDLLADRLHHLEAAAAARVPR